MRVKIKTQKNPQGFQHSPKKSLGQKLNVKKSHAEFLSLKMFQKGLNDIVSTKKVIKPVDKHDGWERSLGRYTLGHSARLLYKRFYETDALNQLQNKFGCTSFAELWGWDKRALPQIFRLFWIPKKSLLKPGYPPKKYLPNFPIPKYPGIENFKPKKNPLISPVTWNLEYPPWGYTKLHVVYGHSF